MQNGKRLEADVKRTEWALVIYFSIVAWPAWSQTSKVGRAGEPLAHQEVQDTLSGRVTTFRNGCRMQYHSYGLPTIITDCGRYDGRYSAWAWGGNELRIVARGGQQKSLFFFRRATGELYAVDNEGAPWEVASIK